MNTISHS